MHNLFQVNNHEQYHLASMLIDEREASDELSRSELCSALCLMLDGLNRSKCATNVPVTLYSSAGRTKARIIQAYIEDTTF